MGTTINRLFGSRERLVLDGAMGTQLIALGLIQGEASIRWNVDHPDEVSTVHRSYSDAGANLLTSNTFGGSPLMLSRFGLGDRMAELNQAAVSLARTAGGGRCQVLGDIGPCGEILEPYGDLTEEALGQSVRAQAEVLARAGVDGFIVETMTDPNEMRVAVQAVKPLGLPILATYAFARHASTFRTIFGASVGEATLAALAAGADAVGANCGTSLSLPDYLELAKDVLEVAGSVPVILQPNAGSPTETGDGFKYSVGPEEFAAWACGAASAGVRILGGCCGTGPVHIRAMAEALSKDRPSQ